MQKVFVTLEVAILINNCYCGHVVSIINRMKNSTHDGQSFTLTNYLIVSLIGSLLVALVLVVISYRKVTHLHHLFVLFTRLIDHKVFSIFFQLFLNFVNYALNEWLLNLTRYHVVVLAKNALNFFSAFTPFILLRAVDTHTIDHEVPLNLFANIFPLI